MVQDYLDRQGCTRGCGASQEPDDYSAGQAAPEFAQACIRAPNQAWLPGAGSRPGARFPGPADQRIARGRRPSREG